MQSTPCPSRPGGKHIYAILLAALLLTCYPAWATKPASVPIVVASKNFTESYILSELIAQTLIAAGHQVERRFGITGTLICLEALQSDEIDIYVEYTGTISHVILQTQEQLTPTQMDMRLADIGLALLPPLGFNNTYAIALNRQVAEERGLRQISDLRGQSDLRLTFSHEFLQRTDGWNELARAYNLSFTPVGIEHGLAYQALAQDQTDVTDAYSTDGEITRYDLTLLEDNLSFFPEYSAVPMVRLSDAPAFNLDLKELAGILDASSMQKLNARVAIDKLTFAQAVQEWRSGETFNADTEVDTDNLLVEIWPLLVRHLQLSGIALLLACLFAIPLSILIHTKPRAVSVTLYFASLLQTIPSIALLALFIPLLGIGLAPAITALFFYSLLPILRNTILGLTTVDSTLIRVSGAMGMTTWQKVRHVTLPLALPSILAGLRTAAVISIGTATLAAFIGAGGLGEPIVTGLALNDPGLILRGAIPAALLAIATELVFELIEVVLIPAHLRHTYR